MALPSITRVHVVFVFGLVFIHSIPLLSLRWARCTLLRGVAACADRARPNSRGSTKSTGT
jgi:hypothetical protein